MSNYPYPESFPNAEEEAFLRLVLSSDEEFPLRWEAWRASVSFDDIGFAVTRLLPLLYLRLRAFGIEGGIAERIRGVYKMVWVKNQMLAAALPHVLRLFAAQRIPVVFMKGVPLLDAVYGDRGARFLGDADMLVPEAQAADAVRVLRAAGWAYHQPWLHSPHRFSSAGLCAASHEIAFENAQHADIDLHFSLFNTARSAPFRDLLLMERRPSADTGGAWERAVGFSIGGVPCLRLADEDLLAHVVIHGSFASDAHRPFRWVADAAHIISRRPVDWRRMESVALASDFRFDLFLGFSYLLEKGFAPVPESFLAALSRAPFSAAAIRAYYARADKDAAYRPFGNFPELWYAYWKHEARGSVFARIARLPGFLRDAWGLARLRDIPAFVVAKYANRFRARIGRRGGAILMP